MQAQTVWVATNSGGAVTGFYVNAAPAPKALWASALASGISITSTGTPALNAIYAMTPQAQNSAAGIAASIASGQGLPHGADTINWPDVAGGLHAFNSVQFVAFADAIRNYVYDLGVAEAILSAGGTAAWPSSSATIP